MGNNKYTESDAAKDTSSSSRETHEAWHAARDDAASSGQLNERNDNKVKDSEHGPELAKMFDKAGMRGNK